MAVNVYPAGPIQRSQVFTSSGTWVCPSGVYSAEFLVVGAGGGGGGVGYGTTARYLAASGGGGGGVKKIKIATVPNSTYTITVGAKGTGAAGAAGTNGGFSEVVLSGTTLIRSLGGRGGNGWNSLGDDAISTKAVTAGGGGAANNGGAINVCGGGGGGAATANMTLSATGYGGLNSASVEGSMGRGSSATEYYFSTGSYGVDGYGGGGGGAIVHGTAATTTAPIASGSNGGGDGARVTANGAVAGSAAVANSGGGGGGAGSHTTTTTAAGGNGGDGIVRITYLS